jgi:hypothetical protein
MNTFFKIQLAAAMMLGMLFAGPALAANTTIQFEHTPLFSEANFLPGESVTRWVKAKNNTSLDATFSARVTNLDDEGNLGSQLNVAITEGGISRYTGTLAALYAVGAVPLSTVGSGVETQYDVAITFNPSANDDYQNASLRFDLVIGSEGDADPEATPMVLGSSGGGGGSGFWYQTPSPSVSPVPSVAGAETQLNGQPSRQLAGGVPNTGNRGTVSGSETEGGEQPASGSTDLLKANISGENEISTACASSPWRLIAFVIGALAMLTAGSMGTHRSMLRLAVIAIIAAALLILWRLESCASWWEPMFTIGMLLIAAYWQLQKKEPVA